MAANPGKGGVAPQVPFAAFVAAIVGQESGGNYQAHSPAGALGKYQILASNIASWSRGALGYQITPQQFLNSPSLQDRIARWKLRQYYDQYGPAGAAAAWYSGDPGRWNDPSPVAGGPSVRDYVRQVLARAGAKGTITAGGVVGKAKDIAGAAKDRFTEPFAQAVETASADLQRFGLQALFVLLGVGLVGVGLYRTFQPRLQALQNRGAELGGQVVKGAAA